MNVSRKAVSALITVGLVGSMLVAGSLPAEAATVGEGKAVIRIDAPKITFTKNADGTYLMKLPKGSKGQWMGERTDSSGDTRARVGNISAKRLVKVWKNFKYGKSATGASVFWDQNLSKDLWGNALVSISDPKIKKHAVTFTVNSKFELPTSMEHASLNIARAAGKQTRKTYYQENTVTIVNDLRAWAGVTDAWVVDARLYNNSNNNTCWSYDWTSMSTQNLKDGRCDNVAYTATSYTYNFKSGAWWPSVFMSGKFTPDGSSQFSFSYTLIDDVSA